ncbi:MAG: glutamate--tRNA ligase [Candidatus Omnitrophica bacterium]|nr:glutamate--tRNA ligase [Candidatus Omnitrophota bacterium]
MVRVRFAPSPTGYLHLGNARTALFNWLFARHEKGAFILRIEDTDAARSGEEYAAAMTEDLKWLGLNWDEGPDVGGSVGPYRQSERTPIYRKYADALLSRGLAYPCYCTPQELEGRRQEALAKGLPPRYDNRCRDLSEKDRRRFQDEGRSSSLRFKVRSGTVSFRDLVRGEVQFDLGLVGDFVIVKSEGTPTFHFAVCVDDGLMGITHVVRGEDHLSNTPRHIVLFEALGFKAPEFAHLSMIGGEGGGLLSKRDEAPSVRSYRARGILAEALVNYLALLGWSPKDNREILTGQDLVSQFSLAGLTKSRAALDHKKLEYVSGQHIRALEPQGLARRIAAHYRLNPDTPWLVELVRAVKDHLVTLTDVEPYLKIVQRETMDFGSCARETQELIRREEARKVLEAFKTSVARSGGPGGVDFHSIRQDLAQSTGLNGKALLLPVRAALTRESSGPELNLIVPLLGKERILKRVEEALQFGKS